MRGISQASTCSNIVNVCARGACEEQKRNKASEIKSPSKRNPKSLWQQNVHEKQAELNTIQMGGKQW